MKIEPFIVCIIILAFSFVGCQNSSHDSEYESFEDSIMFNTTCGFYKSNGRIRLRDLCEYDIIPVPKCDWVSEKGKFETKVEFKLFNYGGEIVVNSWLREDIFYEYMAPNFNYWLVDRDYVQINQVQTNTRYGEWAIGRVCIPKSNEIITNVFISPLAFRYINKNADSGCLIFTNLFSYETNMYFCGIFYGSDNSALIIRSNYDIVARRAALSTNTEDAGRFWKKMSH